MSSAEIRERFLRSAAPAVLVLVAAVQAYNVRQYELTPWKGGGFGMFSTIDEPGRRIVRCYLVGDGGHETPLRIPPSLERLTWEVRAIPTSERVSRLASAVAEEFNLSLRKIGHVVGGRFVRVEVSRVVFDSRARELRAIKIHEETVER